MAKTRIEHILSNVEKYNAIPFRGELHFGYETKGFRSPNNKWLSKAATFKAVKVDELYADSDGVFKFNAYVTDYTIAYMISGKQVSREEWLKEAGYEVSDAKNTPLLTFTLVRVQGLSAAK